VIKLKFKFRMQDYVPILLSIPNLDGFRNHHQWPSTLLFVLGSSSNACRYTFHNGIGNITAVRSPRLPGRPIHVS